jgi:hypothetical protein
VHAQHGDILVYLLTHRFYEVRSRVRFLLVPAFFGRCLYCVIDQVLIYSHLRSPSCMDRYGVV